LNNIIQFILSGTIPNEICRNDTYKVLKGIWQTKPWALRSKYLLHGCEDCNAPILLRASQKTEEKYFVGCKTAPPVFLLGLESNFPFISILLLTGQISKWGKRIAPREYNAWRSQEILSVYRLNDKDN